MASALFVNFMVNSHLAKLRQLRQIKAAQASLKAVKKRPKTIDWTQEMGKQGAPYR